ncbi:hypothetical protein [Bdellovibrio sp. HCB337]|uniref:hypothetical protein n=1 Tax=Bdellovibrio sp. HCB337 TaxID=3394358 RepID=UPI0039A6AB30
MSLTKNFRFYTYILVAALALTACAKRESGYKARRNASGATYTDGARGEAADAAAAAMGYNTDILGVMQPQSANSALSVTSYIRVNANNYQVVTTHYQALAISKTVQNFDGATFEVNGVCANNNCNPYYLIVNITRGGQQIKQTAMKKYFYYTGAESGQDLILSRGAGEFVSVQDAINELESAVIEGQ